MNENAFGQLIEILAMNCQCHNCDLWRRHPAKHLFRVPGRSTDSPCMNYELRTDLLWIIIDLSLEIDNTVINFNFLNRIHCSYGVLVASPHEPGTSVPLAGHCGISIFEATHFDKPKSVCIWRRTRSKEYIPLVSRKHSLQYPFLVFRHDSFHEIIFRFSVFLSLGGELG